MYATKLKLLNNTMANQIAIKEAIDHFLLKDEKGATEKKSNLPRYLFFIQSQLQLQSRPHHIDVIRSHIAPEVDLLEGEYLETSGHYICGH